MTPPIPDDASSSIIGDDPSERPPTAWCLPDRLFDGERLLEGTAIRIEDGRVTDGTPVAPGAGSPVPGEALMRLRATVAPGFVDLQVNGGGGALVNADPTPAGLATIAAAHRAFGTVAILPTVITDAPEVMERAAEAAIAARGHPGLLGLHIEGPHIALARRGTHAARLIRPWDDATLALARRLRGHGLAVMVTLAPEVVPPEAIASLAATGAVVSIGHTDATADQARAAIAAGAGAFTHLFNAMSPLGHRAPGVVGAALGSQVPTGLIADGIHVAPEVIALALRARPGPDLTFLVSDAMPTVGGPDAFRLYDMDLRVEDGRLVNPEGSLAGAHTTMADGVQRLAALATPEAALRAAITVPARLIGRPDLSTLVGRDAADLLVLRPDMTVAGPLAP